MIWILVTAGYLVLLAAVAALCDRLDKTDKEFWEGFAQGHQVARDERRLQAAYGRENISEADLKALDEWWDQFRGRRHS